MPLAFSCSVPPANLKTMSTFQTPDIITFPFSSAILRQYIPTGIMVDAVSRVFVTAASCFKLMFQ